MIFPGVQALECVEMVIVVVVVMVNRLRIIVIEIVEQLNEVIEFNLIVLQVEIVVEGVKEIKKRLIAAVDRVIVVLLLALFQLLPQLFLLLLEPLAHQ
jgi:hypothetical protein